MGAAEIEKDKYKEFSAAKLHLPLTWGATTPGSITSWEPPSEEKQICRKVPGYPVGH